MKRGFLLNEIDNTKSKDRQSQLQQQSGAFPINNRANGLPNHFRSEDRVGVTKFNRGPSAWGRINSTSTSSANGSAEIQSQAPPTRMTTVSTATSSQSASNQLHQEQQSHVPHPWSNVATPTQYTSTRTPGSSDGLSHAETIAPSLTGTDISCMTSSQPSVASQLPDADMMNVTEQRHAPTNNPYAGEPLLPCKTTGVPKAALSGWYGQKPRCHQLSKNQYVCWHDGGMPHKLRFTCVFVCPLTGECFASGRYGTDPNLYQVQEDATNGGSAAIVWYSEYKDPQRVLPH